MLSYSLYEWDDESSQWVYNSRRTYYYPVQSSIDNPLFDVSPDIIIYPNPTMDFIRFTVEEISDKGILEIYNVQGKIVLLQSLKTSNFIEVSQLESGLYFLRIIQGNRITDRKIIIK